MEETLSPTESKKGYTDGIKYFYTKEEIPSILLKAMQKNLSNDDPTEGRAYIVMQEMPDAKVGTVLRPLIDNQTGKMLAEDETWGFHYGYVSKYTGRQSILHREIVEKEQDWFWRIN